MNEYLLHVPALLKCKKREKNMTRATAMIEICSCLMRGRSMSIDIIYVRFHQNLLCSPTRSTTHLQGRYHGALSICLCVCLSTCRPCHCAHILVSMRVNLSVCLNGLVEMNERSCVLAPTNMLMMMMRKSPPKNQMPRPSHPISSQERGERRAGPPLLPIRLHG